ncbi:MAG: FHA domain-containing protein, partial [Chloroflexi bacterium]|nr:FHA domain-containing protein [Chloroflexota bacterium]
MQQNDSFRLVVRRGPQPNQAFEVSKDVNTLGRDISNDIVINDRETSRHHLRLMLSGDTLTIED